MKDKIITFSFVFYLFSFFFFHIILSDKEISFSERRKLAKFPEFSLSSDYVTNIEKYMLDNFPLREEFRNIKALYNYNFLKKLDNNDIFIRDNYIFKSNYPLDVKSVENFKRKTSDLMNLFTNENNIYMMVIPDKNYYLKDESFLQLDYEYIFNELEELNINLINIQDTLNLSDYYETDTHWKQENLDKVVKKLGKQMNFAYENLSYNKNVYDKFYGVYYGESALKRIPETLIYLTNDITDNASVSYLENLNFDKVYNEDKLSGLDAYDVFLDGASAFIEIYNDNASINKELIIFRDSFASSLAPLLINYYSKISLVDNRYIGSENIKKYLNFTNQDILIMYSTLLINSSYTLKG